MNSQIITKLKIAVSQFPVEPDIKSNLGYISKHIRQAIKKEADIIHFPELALSGYETEINQIDWKLLEDSLQEIRLIAKKDKIHIGIGTHTQSPHKNKPYNSTLLISDQGKIAGNYIKTKLYKYELERFSSKNSFFTYQINGVKCGFLICYESCFPDLFTKYKKAGTKILFLSYHNAKSTKPKNSMDTLMKSQFITRATDNLMYISGSNSSSYYSRMPSSFVSPDGKIISAKRHIPGIIIGEYPNTNLGWTYDNRE